MLLFFEWVSITSTENILINTVILALCFENLEDFIGRNECGTKKCEIEGSTEGYVQNILLKEHLSFIAHLLFAKHFIYSVSLASYHHPAYCMIPILEGRKLRLGQETCQRPLREKVVESGFCTQSFGQVICIVQI